MNSNWRLNFKINYNLAKIALTTKESVMVIYFELILILFLMF